MNHPFLVSIFLGIAVLTVGIGCLGLILMRGAAAKLHFVNGVTLVAPLFVLAAVLTEEGLSQAGLKSALIVLLLLIQSPVLTHVVGRAIHSHERRPLARERRLAK